jgi:hypothetical protein
MGVLTAGYRELRDRLIADGVIAQESDYLRFAKDYLATSSSQAASIIAGGNRSGPGS